MRTVLVMLQRLSLIPVLVLGLLVPAAASINVAPLRIEINLDQGRPGAELRVRNTTGSPKAVEVQIVRRVLDGNGAVVEKPADDDFVVFPAQTLIAGGATQVFRLQWVGKPSNISDSYYAYVGQLPVDTRRDAAKSGVSAQINFIYRYGVSIHVIPPGTKSNFNVLSASAKSMPDGSPGAELTIENQGSSFGRFEDHKLAIEANGKRVKFTSDELHDGLDGSILLPNQKITLTFPVEAGMASGISANIRPSKN